MRVKIILHGHLRKVWPSGYECEAETAAEAMNAYVRMNKIAPFGLNQKWVVKVVDHPTDAHLYSPLRTNELHIVPAFAGSGGVVKIVIGVVLIAAAILSQGTLAPIVVSLLAGTGISLALGGVLELLSPTPKITPITQGLDVNSKYLGTPKNTTAIGTHILIGFGRHLVYGQILSFNLEADPAPTGQQPPSTNTLAGF